MITVVTPFRRIENLPFLIKALEGKCNWILLVDDHREFASWHLSLPVGTIMIPCDVRPGEDEEPLPLGTCIPNLMFNKFIEYGLDDDTQYMILCDDDSVEEGFFDKIPNEDVVITSMKRGQRIPEVGCGYGLGDLIASPDNIEIGKVAGEQCIVKGKVLKDYRYGLSTVGDGEMIMKIVADGHKITYVPEANVLFNYFEDGRYDSFRRKPVVMFVGDYYCAANPAMGISEWETNLWKSLESTGLVDVCRFHMDKYYFYTATRGDETLIERIAKIKPDYVVLVVYKPLGSDPTVLTEDTLKAINVPLVTIWGDLEASEQVELAKTVDPYCVKVIGTANKSVVEELGYTYMHVPKDPTIFNDPHLERDIDVVFSGSFGHGRPERSEVLQHLLNNGVNLIFGGSEGGDHFTTEEYAMRYKRAKIAISFSQARGMNVVNARPFEAMNCGTMLLEQESPELAKLYKEGEEYVSWKDKDDLLWKIRYYLEHEDERRKVANDGYVKTKSKYSADSFWKKTLNLKDAK